MNKLLILMLSLCFLNQTIAKSSYNRKEWGPFIDKDKNCLNTRAEVLKKRSLIPVQMKKCRVVSGKWKDFYYDEIHTQAKLVDIDHIVPVEHAFRKGGKNWSKKKKKAFYNDEENLVITNRKYNRQKKSKDITEWMPSNRVYACRYARKWFYIKNKYGLTLEKIEYDYLKLLKCSE